MTGDHPNTREAPTTDRVSVRTAILRAADYIEEHPDHFRYASTSTPDCGTQACAAGWVAHFMGKTSSDVMDEGLCEGIFGVAYSEFDERMDHLSGPRCRWMGDPVECASTLRAYADMYHPEAAS